jgi:hypothetical protein
MKIRFTITKSILALVACILIGWATVGDTSEQWDARTTARVNLRTDPGSAGVILSIVPQGHRVRILGTRGPWCKVDVEGSIHGKGWVYAEYLEGILPKALEAESSLQTMETDDVPEVQLQGVPPAEQPPVAGKAEDKATPTETPLPEKVSMATAPETPSVRKEPWDSKLKTDTQPKADILETGDSAHMAPLPTQSKTRTEVSDNASKHAELHPGSPRNRLPEAKEGPLELSQADPLKARKPIQSHPAQPANSAPKRDTPERYGASYTGAIEPARAALPLNYLPGVDEKQIEAAQDTLFPDRAKAVTEVYAAMASSEKSAEPFERTRPITQQVSMGPVELALKLLSLGLTSLVVLLLHRSNKIATSRYDALLHLQHVLDSRQSS